MKALIDQASDDLIRVPGGVEESCLLGDEKEFGGIEFIQMREQGFKKEFERVQRPAMFTDDAGPAFSGMLDEVVNGFPPAMGRIDRATPANDLRRGRRQIMRTERSIVCGMPRAKEIRIHTGQGSCWRGGVGCLVLAIGTGGVDSILNRGLPDMRGIRPAAPELPGGDPYCVGQSVCEREVLLVYPFVQKPWREEVPNRED